MSELTGVIGFIGGGNMARAIIGGLLQAGHPANAVHVAEPDDAQQARLRALDAGIRVTGDNDAVAAEANLLLLAVKPQIIAAVTRNLGSRPGGQLVVSIAAGISLRSLHEWLGPDSAIVRVMPNQPALVGAGMSVLAASPTVNESQRAQAELLLSAAGQTGWVEDERLLDVVTAVSGSGPAYFYLLMEILEDWARHMGIPDALAAQLARQTGFGAGLTARDSDDTLPALRRQVTSPGGTTAAAIESLENGKIRTLFRAALDAAHARAIELGALSDDKD